MYSFTRAVHEKFDLVVKGTWLSVHHSLRQLKYMINFLINKDVHHNIHVAGVDF